MIPSKAREVRAPSPRPRRALGLARFPAVLILATLLVPTSSAAQEPPGEGDGITVAALEAIIRETEASSHLSEERRTALLDLYRLALEEARSAVEAESRADEFDRAAAEAPSVVERLRDELAAPAVQPEPTAPEGAPMKEMEAALALVTSDLASARQGKEALDAEAARREERAPRIPDDVAALRTRLQETEEALRQAPATEEGEEISKARRTLLLARKRAAEAGLQALAKEAASYEATGEALSLNRQKATRDLGRLEALQRAWQERILEARGRRARQAEEDAKAAAARAHPSFREWAAENARLASESTGGEGQTGLVARIAETARLATQAREERGRLKARFEKARARASTGSVGIANLLIRDRANLPDSRGLRRRLRVLRSRIMEIQRRQMELEDRIEEGSDTDADVAALLAAAGEAPGPRQEVLATQARTLVKDRQDLLRTLKADYDTLFRHSLELTGESRDLLQAGESFGAFINERLIWIRSDPVLGLADLGRFGRGLRDFFRPEPWLETGASLVRGAARHPVRTASWLIAIAAAFAFRGRLRRRMDVLARRARDLTTASATQSVEASFLAVVAVAGGPLIVWFLARSVSNLPLPTAFADSLAAGLSRAAALYLVLAALRRLLAPGGVCEVHFDWPRPVLERLHRNGRWFLPLAVLGALLHRVLEQQGTGPQSNLMPRVMLIPWMLVVAAYLAVVIRPRRWPSASEKGDEDPTERATRLRFLGYGLCVASPLVLAALAVSGYTYAATRLLHGLWATFLLAAGLLVFRSITMRWLKLARRRLAIERARRMRREARLTAGEEGIRSPEEEGPTPEEEGTIPLAEIDLQTRTVIKYLVLFSLVVGLWWIWSDVVPALSLPGRVTLWETAGPGADGAVAMVPITIADVVLAIIIGAMTVLAARHVPGVLEIAVLQRLPITPGARYAAVTLFRYVIAIAGVVLFFATIGIGWSKIQWLIAAMTVGLGFGLQEIFANFVSGLIILFERPMRVGDVVTVGEITGRVTRIRTRATTILNWDRKELLVPNKEFITGQLINWTLSDSAVRLIIPVGVAYGSDTAKARDLLLQAASENPNVLPEPEPTAFFSSFGANSLDFELRVFLPRPEAIPATRHELHETIDGLFRAAGVEIAFPQRDLHLRTVSPEAKLALMEPEGRAGSPPPDEEDGERPGA